MTGVGPVPVKVPRVRDRGDQAEKVRFTSSILPPYLRKAKSVEELLPWLYLKGISTGDFQEALAALLGPNAAGLSSTTISRLKADWWEDYERWQRRDLSARRIVYVWADGVYFQPRMDDTQCVLVLIGADEWGRKEILGLTDGYRESTQSWRELLLDLKRRGLSHPPDLAIGDGALGFWAALREVFGDTCAIRGIRPVNPTTSGHWFRSIRPPLACRLEACCFRYQFASVSSPVLAFFFLNDWPVNSRR